MGSVLEMAKTLGRLQESLLTRSLKRGMHRRGAAMHCKMPRRDIGKGKLVASGSVIICGHGMRFSCYLRSDVYALQVCDIATCCTTELLAHASDTPILAKGRIHPQDDEDFEDVDPPIDHTCHYLLRSRTWVSFARGPSGKTMTLKLDRCIYFRGHGIPVLFRNRPVPENPDVKYILVKVFLEFGSLLFSGYDVASRKYYEYKVDSTLAKEMVSEYKSLEQDEFGIQMAYTVSMMCLLKDQDSGEMSLMFAPEDDTYSSSENEEEDEDDDEGDDDDDDDEAAS